MKPRDATTEAKQLKLTRDNKSVGAGYILLNGPNCVVLRNQRVGEESTGRVEFTHREFNVLIDWYNRDQESRRR